MVGVVDIWALALMAASTTLFGYRYARANPPVYPYLIISVAALVSNWVGDLGGQEPAVLLLTAASFSFLGCVIAPAWRSLSNDKKEEPVAPAP
ncbi:MAG: XrtV sorting system accessory protein [Pseudomonadota bacterium]